MAGRQDYKERKERRKENYQELADKSRKNSKEYYELYENMSTAVPFGQPILVDHYSAKAMRSRYNKMNNAINKSIETDKKAEYYENKISIIKTIKVFPQMTHK